MATLDTLGAAPTIPAAKTATADKLILDAILLIPFVDLSENKHKTNR
jgi:hypothetical protein